MTPDDLIAIYQCSAGQAAKWADPLTAAMDEYEINTPARQAAFLAQVGHESGRLVYVREIWGPTDAQMRYSGRADLGNTEPQAIAFARAAGMEVGRFYAGHGLIQVTGYTNHARTAARLGIECAQHPELLCEPINAARSAGDFWQDHGLNELADEGRFETITRRINGGLNGYADRCVLWDKAKRVLGVA
jgi:putative chitinase